MNGELTYGKCKHCGRTDVPKCPACGKLCSHGDTPGTYLPCDCGGMGPATIDRYLANAFLEYNHRRKEKKDVS